MKLLELKMPRARRVRRLFPIALSPTELWEALGGAVSQRAIIRAIKDGSLIAYKAKNGRRSVLVVDVVEWVRRELRRVS
jgi:hypothetical protein